MWDYKGEVAVLEDGLINCLGNSIDLGLDLLYA